MKKRLRSRAAPDCASNRAFVNAARLWGTLQESQYQPACAVWEQMPCSVAFRIICFCEMLIGTGYRSACTWTFSRNAEGIENIVPTKARRIAVASVEQLDDPLTELNMRRSILQR